MATFGQRLVEIRKQKKLSQRELAKQLNKPFTAIGKYERGETIPSIEMVRTIAECLDIPMSYFVDDQKGYELLADKKMIDRFQDLQTVDEETREHILYALDSMLRDAKTQIAYR